MIFRDNIPKFDEDIFIIPVLSDIKKHWVLNRVSFIYIYTIQSRQEYIFSLNHNDAHQIQINFDKLTTKKQFVYNSKMIQGYEAKTLVWLQHNQLTKFPTSKQILDFYSRFRSFENINDAVPITLFFGWLRNIKDDFMFSFNKFSDWEVFENYSQFHKDLSQIECHGLYTNQGYEYTEYNPYTLTGRPSNSFNNINYAALNKSDNSRERFISRFGNKGRLVEIDLKAFHINLLSSMVGYSFPDTDIYGYLSQFYSSEVSAKEETFRQIYGGISDDYLQIEFFAKVNLLTKSLYKDYLENELKTPIFNRNISLKNLNDLKVLNYILQASETEHNAILISELVKYLYNHETKLILYTYDSFLFDFNIKDGKEVLDVIKKIFNNIPFRLKYGSNLLTIS